MYGGARALRAAGLKYARVGTGLTGRTPGGEPMKEPFDRKLENVVYMEL